MIFAPATTGLGEAVMVMAKSAAGFTICVNAGDVLPLKLPSPPYSVVIGCDPTESEEVVNIARPDAFRAPVPSVVVPSLKVIVPVGVPDPGAVTFTCAVKVTD